MQFRRRSRVSIRRNLVAISSAISLIAYVALFRGVANTADTARKELLQRGTIKTSARLEALQPPLDYEKYTIRINTYQRNEQLLVSLNHHASCDGVAQIQVIWCDSANEPPMEILNHPSGKVVVERHTMNSLNERFHILLPTPTRGIFSMDDDVLRPCQAIDSAFFQWTRHPERMVGYDPRVHVVAPKNEWRYGSLSIAEGTGTYSMVLTRSVFLHRDYLNLYSNALPKSILDTIINTLNCEDIAMTLLVSTLTDGKPPLLASLWARNTLIKLYHTNSISGENNELQNERHRKTRNFCLDNFASQLGLKEEESSKLKIDQFPVQCSSEEEYNAYSFSDASAASANLAERELLLIEEWNSVKWKHALVHGWVEETSAEAKEKGLLTNTREWQKRYTHN